jgi:hypothetical protein
MMGNKKPLEKGRFQGHVRGICLPSNLKDKLLYRKTDKKSSVIINDNQDEVGFVLDMALKKSGPHEWEATFSRTNSGYDPGC